MPTAYDVILRPSAVPTDVNIGDNQTFDSGHVLLQGTIGGASTASGGLGVTRHLVASATGTSTSLAASGRRIQVQTTVSSVSSTSATLTMSWRLASVISGAATTSAVPSRTARFVGTSAGVGTSVAALRLTRVLAGSSQGVASTTAALRLARVLLGTSSGLATSTATLRVTRALSGSLAGSASVTSTVRLARVLQGLSSGAAVTTCALQVTRRVSSTATGQASVSSVLIVGSGFLAQAVGLGTTTGVLHASRRLTASLVGQSTTSSALSLVRQLVVQAIGQASVLTSLGRTRSVQANVAGSSSITSSLVLQGDTAGSSAGFASVTGASSTQRYLVGSVAGSTTISSALHAVRGLTSASVGTSIVLGATRLFVSFSTGISAGHGTAQGVLDVESAPPPDDTDYSGLHVGGPRQGYWLKLAEDQTPETLPLGLIYDAPPAKRPTFDDTRTVEYVAQTSDFSKAFVVLSHQPGGFQESMFPVTYDIVPVLLSGTKVSATVSATTTFPFHYHALDQVEEVGVDTARLWGRYNLDVYDSNVDGTIIAPNALVSGDDQPVGGRVVIRQYTGFLGFQVKDNGFHWDGSGWVFDETLHDWTGTTPLPVTSVEYFATFTRLLTYHDQLTPPSIGNEESHGYGTASFNNIPGFTFDGFSAGYDIVDGPDLNGPGSLAVMLETLDDDFVKVDLTTLTDLTYGPDPGSQKGDVAPIGSLRYALYAVLAADLTTLHYGLLGPATRIKKLKVGAGSRATYYE